MVSPVIPESATARRLLDLAVQRASCEVPFGQRVVVLCEGEVTDVECDEPETSLDSFLVAAGRLDERERVAVVQLATELHVSVEQAVLELALLEPDALRELRRAQLLERLLRAFAAHDDGLPTPRPIAPATRGQRFDTCELVLDVLVRRAALGPAETVGQMRRARFVWRESALEKRAAVWADLGDIPHAITASTLLSRHPSAASRIAALIAAGLARLDTPSASEVPVSRPLQQATTKPPQVITSRPYEVASPTEIPSLLPHNGVSTVPMPAADARGPLDLEPPAWWLPVARFTLDDPIAPLEQQVSFAEGSGSPTERANAWLGLAAGFRLHQRSLLEATRAAREAAAAAGDHAGALALAAELSAASGHPEVAYPYAMAWAAHAQTQTERAQALAAASQYAQRQGRADAALVALRSAASAAPEDVRLQERLARAMAEQGDVQAAVELAQQCVERMRNEEPVRARLLLGWAARLAPANLRTWNQLAKLLGRSQPSLAVATLAHAARSQTDAAARERLRGAAISAAEASLDARAASAISLESYDAGHGQPESLASQLRAAEAWAELAIVAEQAAQAAQGSERANLLVLAAEAHQKLSGGTHAASLLLATALSADPRYQHASEALDAISTAADGALIAIEALERALRHSSDKRAVADKLLPRLQDEAGAALSLWVHEQLPELAATVDLAERKARYDHAAHELEHALRGANSHERTRPALELAAWLRRDPERRGLARKLYQKVLEREPRQREALQGLETLLMLEGDHDALLQHYAQREATPANQLAAAYAAMRAGRPAIALEAALDALPESTLVGAARPEEHEACVLAWRLATLLGDAPNAERALRAWAERGPTPAQRAIAWLRLAVRAGSRDAAEAALANDPHSAGAALLLFDQVEQLTNAASIPVLRAMRAVLGDQPELLRALARASFAADDAAGQREALEALHALVPDDGFAARALVALRTTGRDGDALARALQQALAPARFHAQTNYVAQRGLARLTELWDAERTLELALPLIEALGEAARPLLLATDALAASVSSDRARSAQLELRAAHASEAERPALLRKLALGHRDGGAAWAAIRCELRLLQLVPEDRAAVERLCVLYAEHGELARLHGALELLIDRSPDPAQRRARLLDLALVSARVGDDPAAAALLVETALAAGGEPPSREELRRGLGLMVETAPERAFDTLLSLAERAPPSPEFVTEALVLAERTLKDPALALRAASFGALRHPGQDSFVRALERMVNGLDHPEAALKALDDAAERCEQPERQAELLLRIARLTEQRTDDLDRVCLVLDRAYRATPTRPVEELWMATAARLFARDVRAGKRAYDRLRDTLHVRAKFGSTVARAAALSTLARLSAEVYLNREDAAGYAEAARAALDAEPGSESERATVLADLQALTHRLVPEPAPRPARRSLPEEAPLLSGNPTLRPAAGSLAPRAIARIVPTALSIPALAPVAITTTSGPAWSTLLEDLLSGNGAANKALSELLARERECAVPLCNELVARARKQGFSVSVLRGLRLAAAGANRHALWRTSSQALAFVESVLRPPPGPKQRDLRAGRMEHALLEARRTPHAQTLRFLAQVAESASPLFRKTPAAALGLTKEPEPVKTGTHAQALAELASIFGVKHDAYLARNADNKVSVFSVQPCSIMIGGRVSPDANELRLRLARAYEYATSENVLVVSHDARGLDTLFLAVRAAFTPASAAQVPREAAALAAELWRTMPSKAQRTMSARVAELDEVPDHATLLREVQLRAARVGLFVTRELDLTLAQLGQDGDPPEYAIDRSEGALNRALEHNDFVRALFDYAFSDAYLDALLDGS